MKIIVCLDDGNGMLFNNRRQSRDKAVIKDVIDNLQGQKLCINEFSAKLFSEFGDFVEMVDTPLKNRTFFAENIDINSFSDDISMIVVYKWNRIYPSDFFCDVDFSKYEVLSQTELVGNSHEAITKISYKKV